MLAVALGATLLAAGCGGKKDGDPAAFCRDNTTLNNAFSKAKTVKDIVPELKANIATIDRLSGTAPGPVKEDVQKLVDAAHTAIRTGNGKPFMEEEISLVSTHAISYCRGFARSELHDAVIGRPGHDRPKGRYSCFVELPRGATAGAASSSAPGSSRSSASAFSARPPAAIC